MKMKNYFTLLLTALVCSGVAAQTVPYVSIHDIQYVSPTNLANCVDSSQYENQLIRTRGIVIVDGGRVEVPSSAVQGGFRPFMYIVDTAAAGQMGPFKAVEVAGWYPSGNQQVPHPIAWQVVAGDVVEVIGLVKNFNRNTQIEPQQFSHINLISSNAPVPQPAVVSVGQLNDQNRVNQLPTGEQWEGAFVEIQNVTVVNVDFFANGTRVSFDVVDANGNRINVSDRFIAQRLPTYQVTNPNSPYATINGGPGTGLFQPPVVGAFYQKIKGIILHSANGCTGLNGRGYELNPFDSTHYVLGATPPVISDKQRVPPVPNPTQQVKITFTANDPDGTVANAKVFWSSNLSVPVAQFDSITATLKPGTTDEYEVTLPSQPLNTVVRYYIRATDNQGNVSRLPTGNFNNEPRVFHYTVRASGMVIPDIQYVLDGGDSPYRGQQVTVKGIVTSTAKDQDMGYVYIQDPDYNEWSGIWLVGVGLFDLFRHEEVQVTGVVEEFFNYTRLQVVNVQKTGKLDSTSIQPVVLNPSDSATLHPLNMEKYEGMLVRFQHPTTGQKIRISEPKLTFGEYRIATQAGFTSPNNSFRVHAGRQSNTAFSSLWVQPVTDTIYATVDGVMNVPPIVTSDTMTFDAVQGIVFFSFSNFKLHPRANDDFIGANFPMLPVTDRPRSPINVREYEHVRVSLYPNPAHDILNITSSANEHVMATITDLQGRVVKRFEIQPFEVNTYDISALKAGVYLVTLVSKSGNVMGNSKLVVQ
ncbi:hypothetical protein AT05_09360 [Schleiferia thermophila str. Yellowstone]|jgi:hypothetical protein|uniref:Putative secreted protein (Por secretion system target) n=2 Tax=Schleiferia thermophila TaxID=884107 RepID=A0A369ACT4_9FLAO|nr:T9SS type A sorting domain-containing protein [Schleiferia thermophila]KFD38647.1 hypothetical protein AT05_09360 [Schleiferia thermophila str. Yellowstone]RCX05224.1 putative secreted protein (Por secretion system target) [Schleiferia thermophila]GCD79263.1 hypothetical protein JCM30197_05100 [Schleiferia thermophila]